MKLLSIRRHACVLGMAVLSASHHAASQTTAPGCPEAAQTPQAGQPLPAAEQLKAQEPQCLHSPPYYRLLGQAWLQQGDLLKAQEALERALMLQPEHPPTQWQYAQILGLLGDTLAAQALQQQLLAQPNLPAALRHAVQAALAVPAAEPAGWAHRTSLAMSAVADSNLNNAALAADLTLTLPQGSITLPVAPAYRRQSGLAALAQWEFTAIKPVQQQLWLLQADLRHRQTGQASQRYTQGELAATWLQAPDAPRQWIGRAQLSHLAWAGDNLFGGARLGLQHQWRLPTAAPCRLALGAEAEWRHYPAASSLNGLYRGSAAAITCQDEAAQQQWQLQWRVGQDHAQADARAGGHYAQQDWRLAWQTPWAAGRLALDYQYATQRDATGYSPLLENNARRQQRRQALGVEYARSVGQGSAWQWFVALEVSQQRSNLAVFSADRQSLAAGIRWTKL